MKTRPNEAIRELRKIIGRTQGEFAAMIGASKDAVASWEIGRNKLSPPFARRIALATGVEEAALRRGRGPLTVQEPLVGRSLFTPATFERHRGTYWGRSDEGAARQHLRHCADALGLLLLAAAKPGGGRIRHRLPGLVDSFIQWCEGARQDFKLGAQIEELLAQRRFKIGQTHRYGQWRNMHKVSPAALEAVGFRDDPRKGEDEELFVGREAVPGWAPGRSMEGPRPAVTRILPRK